MEAVRNGYAELGVKNYYIKHGDDYSNPHELIIRKIILDAANKGYIGQKVLDLCCGSGEVTSVLKDEEKEVIGVDPYTSIAYLNRTGQACYSLSFKDIVEGKLQEKFDTIICSFALHLCQIPHG